MKLQIALDFITVEKALEVAGRVSEYADILEIGTPLLKAQGLSAVRKIKTQFPLKEIFCDMKTADAGTLETKIAFDAGATYTSVLACASDKTVKDALLISQQTGIKVVFDLMGSADKVKRAKELMILGAEYVHVHCGLDEQAMGKSPLTDLLLISNNINIKLTAAGGVNRENIDSFLPVKNLEILMIGNSITGSENPQEEARWFFNKINGI